MFDDDYYDSTGSGGWGGPESDWPTAYRSTTARKPATNKDLLGLIVACIIVAGLILGSVAIIVG